MPSSRNMYTSLGALLVWCSCRCDQGKLANLEDRSRAALPLWDWPELDSKPHAIQSAERYSKSESLRAVVYAHNFAEFLLQSMSEFGYRCTIDAKSVRVEAGRMGALLEHLLFEVQGCASSLGQVCANCFRCCVNKVWLGPRNCRFKQLMYTFVRPVSARSGLVYSGVH